jgi:hypothetical protein
MTTVVASTDRILSMTSGHPEVVIESGHRWG